VANYLTLIGLAALFAANAAFAFWAARRPTEVLRLVARRAPRDDGAGATAMTLVSRSAPYRWLLSGNDWFGFVQLAPVEPHRFPRLVPAIRSLGLVTLLLNLSIVTLVVALIVAARL
jgi:hypothetical protein